MISATKPTTKDATNYSHVANHRVGTSRPEPRAQALWPEVQQLYGSYLARVQDLTGPHQHALAATDQVVLRDNAKFLSLAYFKNLRTSILESAGGRCAACNNVKANELDHYLPKEHFAEYAIFGPNLTPICTPCNKKKLDRYRRASGGRRYVHPYFDALPHVQFIECTVAVGSSVTTTFSLAPPAGTPTEIASIMGQHFSDLGLAQMYGEEATNEIQVRLGSIFSYFRAGDVAEVQKYLRRDGLSAERHYGINHWQPVTLKALARSIDFCDGGFKVLGADPLI